MKKYYMTIPQQQYIPDKIEGLKSLLYADPENIDELRYNKETRFPLIPLLSNTASKGEKIAVYLIKPEYPVTDHWLEEFLKELDSLKAEIGFECDAPAIIDCSASEVIGNHLDIFGKLSETAENDDKIYCDITYGTKVIPIIMMMFMNFAYKCRENVSIENVIYGSVKRIDKDLSEGKLYDVTALFYMNSTVTALDKCEDPLKFIRSLLEM